MLDRIDPGAKRGIDCRRRHGRGRRPCGRTILAVLTMARISSSIICWLRPPATFDSTPPVAANLMRSAPGADLLAHGPAAILGSVTQIVACGPRRQSGSRDYARCVRPMAAADRHHPSGADNRRPGELAVVDGVSLSGMISRGSAPRSRTVVKPASRVLRALRRRGKGLILIVANDPLKPCLEPVVEADQVDMACRSGRAARCVFSKIDDARTRDLGEARRGPPRSSFRG